MPSVESEIGRCECAVRLIEPRDSQRPPKPQSVRFISLTCDNAHTSPSILMYMKLSESKRDHPVAVAMSKPLSVLQSAQEL
jgi:hypothetical protein